MASCPSDPFGVLVRLSAGALRHIRCNLTCKYDFEVQDAAGDTLQVHAEVVGRTQWVRLE